MRSVWPYPLSHDLRRASSPKGRARQKFPRTFFTLPLVGSAFRIHLFVKNPHTPMGYAVLNSQHKAFDAIFFTVYNSLMHTPVPDAFIRLWILPRPNKVSTGHFFTLPLVGSAFRIHLFVKNPHTPVGYAVLNSQHKSFDALFFTVYNSLLCTHPYRMRS